VRRALSFVTDFQVLSGFSFAGFLVCDGLSTAGAVHYLSEDEDMTMARKPTKRVEFVLFDVLYEDGSQRSNRKVPSDLLGGLDGDNPARALIEEQDRVIAEKSGVPKAPIKSIKRSGSK
jgi:hypothetical protein